MLNTITSSLHRLTDEDFSALITAVLAEQQQRASRPAQADIIGRLRKAGALPRVAITEAELAAGELPLEWRDPEGVTESMHLPGDVVTHAGHTWISRYPSLNSWEPGADHVGANIWELHAPEAEGTAVNEDPEQRPAAEHGQ